jgi:flagellar biosynthetic protein FliR
MTLHVNIAWLFAVMLLSLRAAAALLLAPVLGPTQVPGPVRVMLSFALAAFITSVLPVAPVQISSLAQLAVAAAAELVIGASLSFGFLAAYAASQVAGRALDIQIGFGFAAIFNPQTSSYAPLLATLIGMAAVAVFLAMDGHHVLVQALALSARNAPPGSMAFTVDAEAVLRQSGVMFTFGAALAAPVMIALLLADLAMAVLARSMPMLNVFVLSFAVKAVLGIVGLAASIRLSQPVLAALYGTTFEYWGRAAGAR